MSVNFPELSSFGTLMSFALAMEEAAADVTARAAGLGPCSKWQDALEACAKKHKKRREQLERMRRERLNEVVLQPIQGMVRDEYVPNLELNESDGEMAVATVAAMEETAARFYEDAARIATNVLGGLDRTLKKLAQENRSLAEGLRG